MKSPRHTTHIRIDTVYEGTKRTSMMLLKDMDCISGCPGKVTYLKLERGNTYKELGSFDFDGEWPINEKENAEQNQTKN